MKKMLYSPQCIVFPMVQPCGGVLLSKLATNSTNHICHPVSHTKEALGVFIGLWDVPLALGAVYRSTSWGERGALQGNILFNKNRNMFFIFLLSFPQWCSFYICFLYKIYTCSVDFITKCSFPKKNVTNQKNYCIQGYLRTV